MISTATNPDTQGDDDETKELKLPRREAQEWAKQREAAKKAAEKKAAERELMLKKRDEIRANLQQHIDERLQDLSKRVNTYQLLGNNLLLLENQEIGIKAMETLKSAVDEEGKLLDEEVWNQLQQELEQTVPQNELSTEELRQLEDQQDPKQAVERTSYMLGLRGGGKRPPHALFLTSDGYILGGVLKREAVDDANTWTMVIYDYYKRLNKLK